MKRHGWLMAAVSALMGYGMAVTSMAQTPTMGPMTRADYPVGANPNYLAVGDLNEDGIDDVVVPNYNGGSISLRVSEITGSHAAWKTVAVPYPFAVALGDIDPIDQGGSLDVVSANYARDVLAVWKGNGMGGFDGVPEFYGTGSGTHSVELVDVNLDGYLDMVAANMVSGTVTIWRNDRSGAFVEPKIDIWVSGLPYATRTRNLDGDGYVDIAVVHEGGTVGVLWGSSRGSYTYDGSLVGGPSPQTIEIEDMNGDGRLDLLVSNCDADCISILFATGPRTFSTRLPVLLPTNAKPHNFAIADVNGDGFLDLVAPNYLRGSVSVLLGDGTGSFYLQPEIAVGTRPFAVQVGDLNGDNAKDIVVTNEGSNSVSILFGDREGMPTAALASSPATAVGGSDAQVAFALSDVSGGSDSGDMTAARLYVRVGGSDRPVLADTLDFASSQAVTEWIATIPAEFVTPKGLQYAVKLRDSLGTSRYPLGGGWLDFPVGVSGMHARHAVPTYVLTGVPLQCADSAPEAVYDELGPYKESNWRYFGRWDSIAGAYVEGPASAPVEPGRGYWIVARNEVDIRVSGTCLPLSEPFDITLQPGWNMISDPFAFPVSGSQVAFPASADSMLWSREGEQYIGSTSMIPLKGYFCWLEGVEPAVLRIDPWAAPADTSKSATPFAERTVPAEGDGWRARAQVECGGYVDRLNWFGQFQGCTDGKDRIDLMEAPAPPGDHAQLAFRSMDGRALMTDHRGLELGQSGAVWKLELDTDQSGKDARLSFEIERPLPDGWRLVAIDPLSLVVADLSASPELLVHIGNDPRHGRTWQLVAGTDAFIAGIVGSTEAAFNGSTPVLVVGPAIPNPVPAGAEMEISLASPRRDACTLDVYDVRGRRVRRVFNGEATRGWQSYFWDGCDDDGRTVPVGVYLVRARVGNMDEVRKVTVIH